MPMRSTMPKPSSSAEPAAPVAPDASLTPAEPYSHRGLTYPFGRTGPEPGELVQLAEGLGWTRSPVPGSLGHINLWVLEDGAGVALVDSGVDIPAARDAWEALFAGPLAGRAVTRIIAPFHPIISPCGGVRALRVRSGYQREWLSRACSTDIRDHRRPRLAYCRVAAVTRSYRHRGGRAGAASRDGQPVPAAGRARTEGPAIGGPTGASTGCCIRLNPVWS